jgi:hypothetical protein
MVNPEVIKTLYDLKPMCDSGIFFRNEAATFAMTADQSWIVGRN